MTIQMLMMTGKKERKKSKGAGGCHEEKKDSMTGEVSASWWCSPVKKRKGRSRRWLETRTGRMMVMHIRRIMMMMLMQEVNSLHLLYSCRSSSSDSAFLTAPSSGSNISFEFYPVLPPPGCHRYSWKRRELHHRRHLLLLIVISRENDDTDVDHRFWLLSPFFVCLILILSYLSFGSLPHPPLISPPALFSFLSLYFPLPFCLLSPGLNLNHPHDAHTDDDHINSFVFLMDGSHGSEWDDSQHPTSNQQERNVFVHHDDHHLIFVSPSPSLSSVEITWASFASLLFISLPSILLIPLSTINARIVDDMMLRGWNEGVSV